MRSPETGFAEHGQQFAPYPESVLVSTVRVAEDILVGIYQTPDSEDIVVKLPNDFLQQMADSNEAGLNPGKAVSNFSDHLAASSRRGWGEGVLGSRDRSYGLSDQERLANNLELSETSSETFRSTTPLRDTFYDIMGLEQGDSIRQQMLRDIVVIGRNVKKVAPEIAGAVRNVAEGLYTEAQQMDPIARRAAAVALISGSAAVGMMYQARTESMTQLDKVEQIAPTGQKPFNFTFSASRPHTLAAIARELGTTQEKLIELNPDIDPKQNVLGGQNIQVEAPIAVIHVDTPTPLKELAQAHNLSQDALRAVNKQNLVRMDGKLLLAGDVMVPGQISKEPLTAQQLDLIGSTTNTTKPAEPAPSTTDGSSTTVATASTSSMPDVFASQRDNPDMGKRPNGKEISASNTCNITSLTMALEQLGLIDPRVLDGQPEQLVVDTYLQEVAPKGLDITDPVALKQVAELFDTSVERRKIANTPEFWQDVKSQLSGGKTAIMSITGHIVHLKDITDEGIVVDDPAGASVLLHKTNDGWVAVSDPNFRDQYGKDWYEFRSLNSKHPGQLNQAGQPGDNNLWPWADVRAYQQFSWMLIMDSEQTGANAESASAPAIVESAPTTTTTPLSEAKPSGTEQLPHATQEFMRHQLPKVDALKNVYQEVERQTGVPWQLMATIHYREGMNNPNQSMMAGERIGSINPDNGRVVGKTLLANGLNAAKHLKNMARAVYDIDIHPDMSQEEIAKALIAYHRGYMYKRVHQDPTKSPYVSNGLAGQEHMHFPSVGEPHSTRGKQDRRPGAIAMLTALNYFEGKN